MFPFYCCCCRKYSVVNDENAYSPLKKSASLGELSKKVCQEKKNDDNLMLLFEKSADYWARQRSVN